MLFPRTIGRQNLSHCYPCKSKRVKISSDLPTDCQNIIESQFLNNRVKFIAGLHVSANSFTWTTVFSTLKPLHSAPNPIWRNSRWLPWVNGGNLDWVGVCVTGLSDLRGGKELPISGPSLVHVWRKEIIMGHWDIPGQQKCILHPSDVIIHGGKNCQCQRWHFQNEECYDIYYAKHIHLLVILNVLLL